jgi:hypothetical protein
MYCVLTGIPSQHSRKYKARPLKPPLGGLGVMALNKLGTLSDLVIFAKNK